LKADKEASLQKHIRIAEVVPHLKAKKSVVALDILSFYIDGSIHQWERTEQDQRDANEASALSHVYESRGDPEGQQQSKNRFGAITRRIIVDLHLYSICADKVSAMMKIIIAREDSFELERFWEEWKPTFERVRNLRRLFEHPHLYLQKAGDEAVFGVHFYESKFVLGSKSFDLEDIGPEKMIGFFDGLLSILKTLPVRGQPVHSTDRSEGT